MDLLSRIYDYINAGAISANLLFSILYTFADVRERFGSYPITTAGKIEI